MSKSPLEAMIAARSAALGGNAEPELEVDEGTLANLPPRLQALYSAKGALEKAGTEHQFLNATAPGTMVRQLPDRGVAGSFAQGVKKGVLDPFAFAIGRPAEDPTINTGLEKTAQAVGTFAGLGISFIPFNLGAGIAMRGLGMAARLSPEVAQAIRYTVAGGIQFAGSSEDLEDLPKNLGLGLAFGGAIELGMLGLAMRNGGRSIDDLRNEIELAPTQGKSASRVEQELEAIRRFPNLRRPAYNVKGVDTGRELGPQMLPEARFPRKVGIGEVDLGPEQLSIHQSLADLTDEFSETMTIEGVRDVAAIEAGVKARNPNATVWSKPIIPGVSNRVFIHSPVDPTFRLNKNQQRQWNTLGYFENQEVIYNGKSYMATGFQVEKGRIQIQDPVKKSITFAPKLSDVQIPTSPRIFSPSVKRLEQLRTALNKTSTKIGFNIADVQGNVVSGTVDTSKYQVVKSYSDFIQQHYDDILKVEAPTFELATAEYAKRRGITGLVEKEGDIITNVRIFDQSTVAANPEQRAVRGFDLLDANTMYIDVNGQAPPMLTSFVPGWRNNLTMNLKEAGVPEKEIINMLEDHANLVAAKMNDLIDPELKGVIEASTARYSGGC